MKIEFWGTFDGFLPRFLKFFTNKLENLRDKSLILAFTHVKNGDFSILAFLSVVNLLYYVRRSGFSGVWRSFFLSLCYIVTFMK